VDSPVNRRSTRLLAVLTLVAAGSLVVSAQVFRTSSDLVLLSVSAVTGQNRPVGGLEQKSFRVFEDGVPQEITFFAPPRLPLSLSILLDASSSMDTKMAVAREAAIGFCRRLNTEDRAQIIAFANEVQVRQPFTSDIPTLEKAVRDTIPGGSTSLYTAIYVAFSELRKIRLSQSPDQVRRQAMVLLSDGEDTTSILGYQEVIEAAKREDVMVYAVGLRAKNSSSPARGFNEADYVMRQLAQSSGGRVFFVSQVGELAGVYGQIADELSSQYTIGYVSKNTKRDGAWRTIAVRTDQPNVAARTKAGYFGPGK
jgi:Ca-activated chloride channel family protein